MKQYLRKNETGLTLLEVLVGMIILAVGLLGFAPMLMLSIETNNIARDYSEASELAKQKLEEYQNIGTVTHSLPYTEFDTDLRGVYDRTTYISDKATDSLIPNNMAKIDIIVTWSDADGRNRTLQYSTLMSKG